MNTIGSVLQGFLFLFLWVAGGWLITRGAFHTSRVEQLPLALIIGITLDCLFANMLGQLLPVQVAFWLAPFLILLIGVGFVWGVSWREIIHAPFYPMQWLALVCIAVIFTMAERGLAIFDDYAHLPVLSLIATGDIPPHFPLNAQVVYYYHYLLLIFAAQLTRISGLEVWKSLDIARALVFSISIFLTGVWVLRVTRSRAAGFIGAFFAALGMGTRWVLLLFPPTVIKWLTGSVNMLGSGSESGVNLAEALSRPWGVEGVGPVAFPFAFANGIYLPGILDMSGPNSTFFVAISVFFLLTFNRWRGWKGAVISGLMTASLALVIEFGLVIGWISWGMIVLFFMFQHKTYRLPKSLWQWLLVVGLGSCLGMIQGGAFTGVIENWIGRMQGQVAGSYQTLGFRLTLEPAIVSSHLGVLSLVQPTQLFLALCEVGPIILILLLLAVFGIRAYRCGRWYEAAFVFSAFLSLTTIFLRYAGSEGVRNTSRIYTFINLCALYAVPLTWMWVSHRSDRLKWGVGVLAAGMMFGGVVILSVKLAAIQRPVYSNFLTALDARMYDMYWDRLEPNALIFDSEQYRGPTVFGRPSIGFQTWFEATPMWTALYKSPDPKHLNAAGFTYAYIDNRYWQEIGSAGQKSLGESCVKLVDEYSDEQGNFRRLFNIEGCK